MVCCFNIFFVVCEVVNLIYWICKPEKPVFWAHLSSQNLFITVQIRQGCSKASSAYSQTTFNELQKRIVYNIITTLAVLQVLYRNFTTGPWVHHDSFKWFNRIWLVLAGSNCFKKFDTRSNWYWFHLTAHVNFDAVPISRHFRVHCVVQIVLLTFTASCVTNNNNSRFTC